MSPLRLLDSLVGRLYQRPKSFAVAPDLAWCPGAAITIPPPRSVQARMLDADTCIAIIKGSPASALKKLRGKSVGQVGISSITLGELAFGAANSGRREEAEAALSEFLLPLEVASFDGESAVSYGQVRASLEKRGTPIGPLDTLIGAHAAALDVILVTHNTREFTRIGSLRLEDWMDSRPG